MEKTKTKIKLIREVYQHNGDLYESLDSCLDNLRCDDLKEFCKNNQVNDLDTFLQRFVADEKFQFQVGELIRLDRFEVTE